MDGIFRPYITIKEVRAVQFTDENKNQVFNSLTGQFATAFEDGHPILKVKTISNETVTVRFGDWLIKEDRLGFYKVLSNEDFKATYKSSTESLRIKTLIDHDQILKLIRGVL